MLFLNKFYQIVQSCPRCPQIAANTMLGICVIPAVALYCSTHVCCAVEHGIACCATHHIAIATLTTPIGILNYCLNLDSFTLAFFFCMLGFACILGCLCLCYVCAVCCISILLALAALLVQHSNEFIYCSAVNLQIQYIEDYLLANYCI